MLSLRWPFFSTFLLLRRSLAQSCAQANGEVYVPPIFSFDNSVAQFTSCSTGHDGPKVSPINQSVYDWWYFDAVSADSSEAIVVIFMTASELGFPYEIASIIDATNIAVFATFADGTSTLNFLDAIGAHITTAGSGASGTWVGAGSFTGESDLAKYDVSINAPLRGVEGTFHLDSEGPGHYPCDQLVGGADEELIPHVGWVNVLPAATGAVDFTVDGRTLRFSGPAYHDKNWGDIPFTSAVHSWYWGHGTLGPYYLVWFDAIDRSGSEHVSGYIVNNGNVVGSTCDNLNVRPIGTPYPPTILSPNPTQFTISMLLNDGRNVSAVVTAGATQINVGLYTRWIGSIEGTIGTERYSGSALWEQFKQSF